MQPQAPRPGTRFRVFSAPWASRSARAGSTLLGLSLLWLLAAACGPRALPQSEMLLPTAVPSVRPGDVREKVERGEVLLVCAFRSESRCYKDTLPKALTLAEFEARARTLPRDTPVVVYCACSGDSTAFVVASRLRRMGWRHVAVLRGGPAAWAGTPDLI